MLKVWLRLIRPFVFFLPILMVCCFFLAYIIDQSSSLYYLTSLYRYCLETLDSLILASAGICLLLTILAYFLPIANLRIGGRGAKPKLSRFQCFSISYCTSIASGILYWTSAEPLIHQNHALKEKQVFSLAKALAIMWHHWSGLTYALYIVPTLAVAIFIYNYKSPHGLATVLPFKSSGSLISFCKQGIDSLCVLAIVCGIASSLATGLMMLFGSIEHLTSLKASPVLYAIFCFLIVAAFVLSSMSGLTRGIQFFSYLNVSLVLVVFIFFVTQIYWGPSLWESFCLAFAEYVSFAAKLGFQTIQGQVLPWYQDWTVFYWSSWIGWAPISALFLAKLSYGYKVREVIFLQFILPTVITIIWLSVMVMIVFQIDQDNQGILSKVAETSGPESILVLLLELLPFSFITNVIVFAVAVVSIITTADSSLTVMAELSATTYNSKVDFLLKLVFGIVIGFFSWIMVSYLGIDGLRVLNNLSAITVIVLFWALIAHFFYMILENLPGFQRKGMFRAIDSKEMEDQFSEKSTN